MEFRGNIIFSFIAHASVGVMILAFAGRNATMPHLPENYIAVSLFESAEEKSSPGEKLAANDRDDARKPETKLRKVPPPDVDRRIEPRNDKAAAPPQPQSDQLSERKASVESHIPYTGSSQTMDKIREQSDFSNYKPAESAGNAGGNTNGAGNLSSPSQYMAQAVMPEKSAGVEVMASALSGGAGRGSLIDQIRAAVEKAKVYPRFARERGQRGAVLVEFSINSKGRPENIRIIKSSGFSLLDKAATDTITRAAPFPAVKGDIQMPIRFTLE